MSHEFGTSIIIPCKDESGNLVPLVDAIVTILRPGDEILIVEGGSADTTYFEALELQAAYPYQVRTIKQSGKGKFDAVQKGAESTGFDIVMIWDADATVNFEQNQQIYLHEDPKNALVTGDRLRGKRDKGAMRVANLIGNWAFAVFWVGITRKSPIDLLCGTKKFPRVLLQSAPRWLLNLDPYGDFTLFAMARHNKIPIISIPVHYHSRSFGKTNIHRWSGGIQLLRITLAVYLSMGIKSLWKK